MSPSRGPWCGIQGYLTYKKRCPPRTLRLAYAQGPMEVLERWEFLMSEIPLYVALP